jgi:DNA (cytosine-5)-methyltransferase 1
LKNVAPLRRGERWPRAAFSNDDGRFSNDLSTWPKRMKARPLHEFLSDDVVPLSARATAGFLKRTEISSLRFRPGFIAALRAHLNRMERADRGR